MKRKLWTEFETAMNTLRWTKGKLMQCAYSGDCTGIDSAVPIEYMREHHYPDQYWLVTDCTTGYYDVIDMRYLIPDYKAKLIIEYAILYGKAGKTYDALSEDEKNRIHTLSPLIDSYCKGGK